MQCPHCHSKNTFLVKVYKAGWYTEIEHYKNCKLVQEAMKNANQWIPTTRVQQGRSWQDLASYIIGDNREIKMQVSFDIGHLNQLSDDHLSFLLAQFQIEWAKRKSKLKEDGSLENKSTLCWGCCSSEYLGSAKTMQKLDYWMYWDWCGMSLLKGADKMIPTHPTTAMFISLTLPPSRVTDASGCGDYSQEATQDRISGKLEPLFPSSGEIKYPLLNLSPTSIFIVPEGVYSQAGELKTR